MTYTYRKTETYVPIPYDAPTLIEMLRSSGLSQKKLAEKHGWGQQALSVKIRRYLGKQDKENLLPWKIAEAHGGKSIYALYGRAWVKMRRGEAKPDEIATGREFERFCRETYRDVLMCYSRRHGFHFRSRRIDDDPESLLTVECTCPVDGP